MLATVAGFCSVLVCEIWTSARPSIGGTVADIVLIVGTKFKVNNSELFTVDIDGKYNGDNWLTSRDIVMPTGHITTLTTNGIVCSKTSVGHFNGKKKSIYIIQCNK